MQATPEEAERAMNIMGRFRAILCWAGFHAWAVVGHRRACRRCCRREVFDGYGWNQHTYPLDGDPEKDPTPYMNSFGKVTTIGEETIFRNLWEEAKRSCQ